MLTNGTNCLHYIDEITLMKNKPNVTNETFQVLNVVIANNVFKSSESVQKYSQKGFINRKYIKNLCISLRIMHIELTNIIWHGNDSVNSRFVSFFLS